MNLKEIGKNIRVRRMILELSQSQLSKMVGVTWEMISRYERGVSSPMERLDTIAKALNCTPSELLQNNYNATSPQNQSELRDGSGNRVRYITKLENVKDITSETFHGAYYAAPDWIVKSDPKVVLVELDGIMINNTQIKKNGPIYLSLKLKPKDDGIVLCHTDGHFSIESFQKRGRQNVIGVVMAQESRFR